jgi:hypothetical protein
LAGTFDIEAIEQAFFNHDHDGAEPAPGQWEERRDQWRSFKSYLAAHPRQEISGRDAYKEEISDKIRHGQPVGIMEALAAIEYQSARKALQWWRKDALGWPIETFKGKPVKSAIRIICQNIRKVVFKPNVSDDRQLPGHTAQPRNQTPTG